MSKQISPCITSVAPFVSKVKFQKRGYHMEKGGGISMTVPGCATDLGELLKRFRATGQVAEGLGRSGYYSDTEDFDDEDLEKLSDEDLHVRTEVVESILSQGEEAKRVHEDDKRKRSKGASPKPSEPKEDEVTSEAK